MPSKTIRPWPRPSKPPQQSRAAHAGTGRHRGVLAGLRILVTGTDASPHLTGFAGFSTAVIDLIEARRGVVDQLRPATDAPKAFAVQADPVDLVIAIAPGPGVAAAPSLADRHDVPLLVISQATSLPARATGGTVGELLAVRLDRALAARADRWAVTSQAAHDQLVHAGVPEDRIDRLPYWADPAELTAPGDGSAGSVPEAARSALRDSLGWPDHAFLVTCPVGADLSDVPLLLATAEELETRNGPARMILVGRGGRLRQLRENAGPAATSVFEVTGSQYPATFAAADMVLLVGGGHADRREAPDGDDVPVADAALAGRVASCLAAGVPMITITGASGVVPEVVAVQDASIQVHAATPQQLADAIETLADARPARALMAAAARARARDLMDPATAADALEATVTATLAARVR